jgi:preprotein translocase subunit SecE
MAVKKKEKPTQGKQSENSGGGKVVSSALSERSAKSKHGGDADRAKNSKTKAISPQKMKSGDDEKVVKLKSGKLPFVQSFVDATQFLNEVRAEARKISWPERSQVLRETMSVLFLVALITVFVWLFDIFLGKFIFAPVEHWGHLYGIGGGA